MRRFQFSIILIIAILFMSCSSDMFYLKNEGAEMPILVKGNKNLNVFILFVHGGPGASGFYDEYGEFFSGIEKKYALIYWEQRAAGISQGNAKPESLTVPKFFEDMDNVITLIRKLYNNPKIFLMCHSWGGGLGTAYLISKSNSQFNGIKGWIDIDGNHNSFLNDSLEVQYVINYANDQIGKNKELGYWKNALAYYDSHSFRNLNLTHTDYLKKAGAYWHREEYSYASLKNMFFSSSTGFDFLENNYTTHRYMSTEDLIPFTADMQKIKFPSLLLWGRYDGVVPVEMAKDAYKKIGTPEFEKQIIIFEESSHSPYVEEKEKFNNSVISFIDKYKDK